MSAAATLLAATIAATGGFAFDAGPIEISVHAVTRPVVAALAFGLAAIIARWRDDTATPFPNLPTAIVRYGLWLAAAFAVVIAVATYRDGAHIAGGADQSGYLSQARLWRSGSLRLETPLAFELSLTHGQHAFTPLGYQPAAKPGEAVPGYPPGLPLLLAFMDAAGGERAQFLVVPLSAAGVVMVAFLLGRRVGGAQAGLIAAAACGASPILLYQAMQPMSDVPAALWWTWSVLWLTGGTWKRAVAAGLCAAVACAVRPNLFVMTPVLAALSVWWSGGTRPAFVRAALFLLAPFVAALGLAALHHSLYGSVTATGYGPLSGLFNLDHALPNIRRYARWAIFTQSALLALAIVAPVVIRRRWVDAGIDRMRAERIAIAGLVCFVALQLFYLLYLVFDDWVSFRFLLPALPWLLVLQAVTIAALCNRLRPGLRAVAVVLVAILIASWGAGRARGLGAFGLSDSEQRYLDAAGFVRGLAPDAVFMTVQHSGSLPYYASAEVLRWDWLEPNELDRVVRELSIKRRPVFVVLDDFEEEPFRLRFTGSLTLHRLGPPAFTAGGPPGIATRVYAIDGTTAAAAHPPFSWRRPPALRAPRMPAAPGPAPGSASSGR